jgi:RNA polymerase sigma-70 factor (ECF subfamily)
VSYRRFNRAVRRYVAKILDRRGDLDADDVVHAAFEKLVLASVQGQVANPEAFLIRTARNYVLDEYRRHCVRLRHLHCADQADDLADDVDPERVLMARQCLDILEEALRTMEHRRREVLLMHRIDGLNCAEIARRLDRSPARIKILLADALLLCKEALQSSDVRVDARRDDAHDARRGRLDYKFCARP